MTLRTTDETAAEDGVLRVTAYEGDQRVGSLLVERVAFDSEIFGISVGRVTSCEAPAPSVLEVLHERAVACARAAKYAHLSRRVLADAYDEIRAVERARYGLVDVGVIFAHDLAGVSTDLVPGVRPARLSDEAAILAECATIFRTSRYYHEPAFLARADEVHRRWIVNSFRGRADAVLVLDDAPAFVTCLVDGTRTGHIELFGVGRGARGRGAGRRLLDGALAWFKSHAERVEVKTQSTNYAAAKVYERGGFRLCRSELTFGRRIESENA